MSARSVCLTPGGAPRAQCKRRPRGLILAALVLAGVTAAGRCPASASPMEYQLRVVGGHGQLGQYSDHERPFWTERIPERSEGRISVEIAPFDESGIRGANMLDLIRLGVVPFGTVIVPLVEAEEPLLGGMDLPGLNPDIATLAANAAAFRPMLERDLRDRYGIELLAVYSAPAQVVFCRTGFEGLGDLHGRRVRSSNLQQSDFLEAIGATPVQLPFTAIADSLRTGMVDCAITGARSGDTIGLAELTSHIHGLPIQWELSIFGANLQVWNGLPADLRRLLGDEIAELERAIWHAAARDTETGLACQAGLRSCKAPPRGAMTLVEASEADLLLARSALEHVVMPRWLERCGPDCAVALTEAVGQAGDDPKAR